jgi:hypothetical protein
MTRLGLAMPTIQRNLLVLEEAGMLKRLLDDQRTILLPVDERWGTSVARWGAPRQRGGGVSVERWGHLNSEVAKPVDSVGKPSSDGDLAVGTDNRKGNVKGKVKGNGKGEVSSGTLTPLEEPRMKIEDVLNQHGVCEGPAKAVQEFRRAASSGKAITGTTVWKLWRDLVAAHHPKVFLKQPSNVQLAQLKSLYKATGSELPPVLVSVVSEWTWFLKYAKENAGAAMWKEDRKAGYTIPNIGFVIKYLELAVNFHRFECQPAPDAQEGSASRKELDTPALRASQEAVEVPRFNASHHVDVVRGSIASQLFPATQATEAIRPLEDDPEAAERHTTTVTPVDVASPHEEAPQGSVTSHSASDTQSQRASHEAIRNPVLINASPELADTHESLASQSTPATHSSATSLCSTDARSPLASPTSEATHPITASHLQSVAKHAVKQVIEKPAKTLTNKLEGGEIGSDEDRRRKEALEILKRY